MWASRPPNTLERVLSAIWLIAFLLAVANSASGWNLIQPYDQQAVPVLSVLGLLLLAALPKVKRVDD